MSVLAIDIGGTFIKYGLFSETGNKMTAIEKIPTSKTAHGNSISKQICQLYHAYQAQEIIGIAIATAGVVDPNTGVICTAGYTIPGYTGTPLKEIIEHETGLPCWIENDVNCALLGECWQNHYPEKNIFCLTIGTGIGGAILINGELYRGTNFSAGEIGYLNHDGPDFQTVANTQSLITSVAKITGKQITNGQQVVKYFRSGNVKVKQAVTHWLHLIAIELANINRLLNPDFFIIGGGIIEGAPEFGKLLRQELQQLTHAQQPSSTALKIATLGNQAGMFGALYYFLKKEEVYGNRHSKNN